MNNQQQIPIKIIVIFSFFIFLNFTCKDCEETLHDKVYYTIDINPLQTNYKIGDTIQLSHYISSMVPLDRSNTDYDATGQIFDYRFHLFRVRPDNQTAIPALNSFDTMFVDGKLIKYEHDEYLVRVENMCLSDTCGFTSNLIAKSPGYYGIELHLGYIGYDYCTSISLYPSNLVDGNNNFSICEEIGTTQFRKDSYYSDPGNEERMYFFKVIE